LFRGLKLPPAPRAALEAFRGVAVFAVDQGNPTDCEAPQRIDGIVR
jgi:hypothetical protein